MSERKSFLLRIDRNTLDAVQRWANDDLRSLNGQIEFLLRRALQSYARTPTSPPTSESNAASAPADATPAVSDARDTTN